MIRYPMLLLALIATAAPVDPDRPRKPGTVIPKATNLTSYRYIDALAEASSVRVDGFDLRDGRAGIRVRGDARHLVIRTGKMTTKGITKGSDLPVGIDVGGTVHDVLIEA